MTEFPAFSFAAAGRILFGRGRATEAAGIVSALGRRPLLVHGSDAARAAWLRHALPRCTSIACPGEPSLPLLESATEMARRAGADVVVALGGGAAIDLGKAVAALAAAGGDPLDHLEVVGRGLPLTAAPLPLVAIPTTAGTGAEVTKNAVIGVPEHRRKVSLRDDRMLPDVALIDPALTDGLPWRITLASGLDALTQVIEPYLSARATPMTDALTRAAIPQALPALRRLERGEDPGARDAMAYVSLTGGLALANSGLGAVHGFAGVIGGLTGAAHGAVCGALLAPVLRALAAHAAPDSVLAARLGEVAAWLSAPLGCAPEQAFDRLGDWAHGAGLPGLAALGVEAATTGSIAEQSRGSSSMKGSAIAFTAPQLQAILEDALSAG
ncbi:iron-containing alcohol dehydrogenase [Acidimangrovimonas pyrenivorans]|uniref:Iron-containing alcohol dehydrogenase n=1 Tax=Acidimangrovimonas pyrenivorans TaxID=2030798 RepID=A0ABV7AKH1_9RHOB